jgi:hypothetical protein
VNWRRVLAVALVAGTVGFAIHSSSRAAPHNVVSWPKGTEHVYALTWKTETSTRFAGTPMSSKIALDGRLVISSYGPDGDATALAARFEGLTRADIELLGKNAMPSIEAARKELEGHTVELIVTKSGDISDVRFRADDPALFRHLMTSVVRELALDLRAPQAAAWTAPASVGPSGSGPAEFVRHPDQPFVVKRTRSQYDAISAWPNGTPAPPQKLSNVSEIKLESSGALQELDEHESFEATRPDGQSEITSTTSLRLTKQSERPFDATQRPEGFVPAHMLAAFEQTETEEQKRKRLAERTAGVTLASVVADIRVHAAAPKETGLRWAWLAQGFLELHPEVCDQLVAQMRGFAPDEKGMTLDLLMSVDHPHAQEAIVAAFENTDLILPNEQAPLMQRFIVLARPTNETASYVARRYAKAKAAHDDPTRRAAAVSLGALVNGVAKTDRAFARQLDDALVLDLYAAKDPRDREVLLLALGNAGLEEDAIAIRLASRDASPAVRAAVATALRRLDGPEIRATLLQLLADPDTRVQLDALSSLDRREPTEEDLAIIDAAIPKLDSGNLEAMVSYLAKRPRTEATTAMVRRVAAREDIGAQTRARALALLDP